jgi:hypothetical protein
MVPTQNKFQGIYQHVEQNCDWPRYDSVDRYFSGIG